MRLGQTWPADRIDRREIGTGDAAIATTLATMRRLVDEAAGDWRVRQVAEWVTRECGSYDDPCVVHRLFGFVRGRVRYRYDPDGVELIRSPRAALGAIDAHGVVAGDCDDSSVLLAALLHSLGYPVRFAAISQRADGELHHVLLEVALGGRWLAVDPIAPFGVFGGLGGRINARRIVLA